MTHRTIIKEGKGVRYERLATSTITPGDLIAFDSSDQFAVHAVEGGKAAPIFAIENEIFGYDVDTDYSAADLVLGEYCHSGMQVAANFAIGSHSISIGDKLCSAGDGTLIKAGGAVAGVETGAVTDDDSAASNGTAVYLHVDEKAEFGLPSGHLESVTAGNADTYFDIGASGPRVRVGDDDAAATGGLQVYFDEDATDPDSRFLVNNTATGKDVFVFSSTGQAIRIKHDASASTNGVALYIDDDGATASARLLFVSPTDAAGSYKTDDSISLSANPQEALAIALEAVGTLAAETRYRVAII